MRRSLLRAAVCAAALLASSEVLADCAALVPGPSGVPAGLPRPITARDLIELRDIGDQDSTNYGLASRLSIAPDGRRIAFSLIRADLDANSWCIGMFVLDPAIADGLRQVDAGGAYVPASDILRGYYTPSGSHRAIVPVWAPDGRSLAYLRRDGGATQAWVAQADGSGARAVSHFDSDATELAWSADGKRLLVATCPGVAEAATADAREARSGWLYDARFTPQYQWAPLLAADKPREIFAIKLAGGKTEKATAGDSAVMPAPFPPGMPVPPSSTAADGRRAWTEREGGGLVTPLVLFTAGPDGKPVPCTLDFCKGGIVRLWWDVEGELLVLRREGWNRENVALYRWMPGAKAGRQILRTRADVQDCEWGADGLICTAEESNAPRRLVLIDRASGAMRTLLDPNPEFARIALGPVRRLRARNSLGLDSWGDLVLPPGHRPGDKLPLVIVQYHSQGFLRGGTGDEYPIFLLAARGFAVLSIERPPSFAAAFPQVKSPFELNRIALRDWTERRSVLSSVEALLDRAIATGDVDPARIGITGLSDGASTVRFAMLNSRRFAAAALSTCCFENKGVTAFGGIALSDYVRDMGFPSSTSDDRAFWKDYSLTYSGGRTATPLLMQLADREALSALEAFQAMRDYRKPIEMYVFPDEYHVKWQPWHRQAIYARSIDWFEFWLMNRIDPDPEKKAQYARWEAMRRGQDAPKL